MTHLVIQNQRCSTFFRESIVDSLSDQHKKIAAVVLAALACIAACYLLYRSYCKPQISSEGEIKDPKDGDQAIEKVDAQKKVLEPKTVPALQDKTPAPVEAVKDNVKPAEIPVDEPQVAVDTETKKASPPLEAEVTIEPTDADVPVEADVPIEKDDPIEEVKAKPASVQPARPFVETLRIMYQGLMQTDCLTEAQLQALLAKYEAYSQDPKAQEEFANTDKDKIYIDVDNFGEANQLAENDFVAFLRYLVLEGKIKAYAEARGGYCLFLSVVGDLTEAFDDTKLMRLDAEMEALSFPSDAAFADDEKEIFHKVILQLKKEHFQRRATGHRFVLTFRLPENIEAGKRVMDQLLRKKVIHSWKQNPKSVSVKIHQDDINEMSDWRKSRNLDAVLEEATFQMEHQIFLNKEDVEKSNLNDKEQQELWKLVEALNKREESGAVKWSCENGFKILDFLKAQKVIVGYARRGWSTDYFVYVQEIDRT